MAVIDDLVDRIEDVELKKRIQIELQKLTRQKKFGLVFENHLPECTPLYEIAVTPGRDVAERTGPINEIWTVLQISGNTALCRRKSGQTIQEFPIDDLVAVASFGEPIYPYLKPIDSLCNAPESDLWHTIIEADNYHALQLLEYLYAGKVDCIYIDPPYNTGAKDWKYNNNYVDGNDAYRHSKWLSFMEKRLKIAKKLLNPKDSVLIVTIDEKEYLHLGCLLEELFPNATIQMITSVINPKGSAREGRFSRVEEYLYFVMLGKASIVPGKYDMLRETKDLSKRSVRWAGLMRNGEGSSRSRIPSLFYPIFIDAQTGKYHSVGEPLPPTKNRNEIKCPDGTIALFPVDGSNRELQWRLYPPSFREYLKNGWVRFGKRQSDGTRSVSYLQKGMLDKMSSGDICVLGKDNEGALILEYKDSMGTKKPATVWNMVSHSASEHGASFIKEILPGRKFPYPKSLYAVQDTLRFILSNKPNALVVDFFAGSGTTLHAINLLNALDNGRRRCILITNNEVSSEESSLLLKKGIFPGHKKWNELGIARYITWPRITCSIRGLDINGKPLKGEYLGCNLLKRDGFKSNVAFFHLGFLDKKSVSIGKQFKELLSILWLKAGAHGPCPSLDGNSMLPNRLICRNNQMAILIDSSYFVDFKKEISSCKEINTVFLVTDNERSYQFMVSELNVTNTYQLYRDYLDNFRINQNRG